LTLKDMGEWNPEDQYWGEESEPIEAWAKRIIARGPRREYGMEQVVPGEDPNEFDSDPLCKANDLQEAGDWATAYKILMVLCQADLRCLDAHAHLGNLVFDHRPKDAIRHYEVGVRIGELSLPPNFDGLLPWGYIDNRPFMRCLHGYGLCLWRLDRFEEARRIFERMLWLNPSDNQGVRSFGDRPGTANVILKLPKSRRFESAGALINISSPLRAKWVLSFFVLGIRDRLALLKT
jgi:tetratricopeptide (TPR) repeat protein